ncbi:hypothetical protein BDW71DRAFT_208913 [Aspergillus fruticulosus]
MRLFFSSVAVLAASYTALAAPSNRTCKITPYDSAWPSASEWSSLNVPIEGTLLRTTPAASSCYAGNPFGSSTNCTDVTDHWSYAAYHASWPESVDYSIFTNHSCLPLGVVGCTKERGCAIGAHPVYVVSATSEEQISTAMRWANDRDIRVIVKGPGHDMSGRSTGAYALSIRTHNLKHFTHDADWSVTGTNATMNAAILGAGNNWGSAYNSVHAINRTLIGGEDATVGLGGLIQNGGHGLLSSTHGLASDSLYQVTSITPDGRRLVANDVQNKELFWAVRGAGGGQFGVVTEFVLATHPVPESVVTGGLTFSPAARGNSSSANTSLAALVDTARLISDIMDAGLTGTIMAMTETDPSDCVSVIVNLTGFNMTVAAMNQTVAELSSRLQTAAHARLSRQQILRLEQHDFQPSPWSKRADWYEEHTEPVWKEWTGPDGESYANEGNVFSSTWKEDFYGPVENYKRLERIERTVDPKGTLFVWGGVESDNWEYGLRDGWLCRV